MNNIISNLEDSITVFGRFLRQAGCSVGSREIMTAIEASSYIEISKREDFHQALKTALISDNKNLSLFDQLFEIYWRNPDKIEKVSDILKKLHESRLTRAELKSMKEKMEDIYQRRDNNFNNLNEEESAENNSSDLKIYSPNEVLKKKRFDSYTNEELEEAKRFINNWEWVLPKRKSRRLKSGKSSSPLTPLV